MTAAVPKYVGTDFSQAPPGHRFRLYFEGWWSSWLENRREQDAKRERNKRKRQKSLKDCKRRGRENIHLGTVDHEERKRSLNLPIPKEVRAMLGHLHKRQGRAATFARLGVLSLEAQGEAPFVTGLGNEHPIENGFTFLDPYGIPCLPGSSIKGVVRRAAEELALFEKDSRGWTLDAIWWLFGFDANSAFYADGPAAPAPVEESRKEWKQAYEAALTRADPDSLQSFLLATLDRGWQAEVRQDAVSVARRLMSDKSARGSIHTQGALQFWDVLPLPPEDRLRVDIMNPHYNHYYQEKEGREPSDDGKPVPISFLALPPGTLFTFHVELAPPAAHPSNRLPDGLRRRWKELLGAALRLAATDLGFGAKTSLGYGLMRIGKEEVA